MGLGWPALPMPWVAASLLLHGAIVAAWTSPAREAGMASATGRPAPMLLVGAAVSGAQDAAASLAPSTSTETVPAGQVGGQPLPTPRAVAAWMSSPEIAPLDLPTLEAVASLPPWSAPSEWQWEANYWPRAELSAPPVLRSTVLLRWPVEVPGAINYTGVVALFIDETGQVRRVRPEDPRMPDALVGVVQTAFLGATFTPGERHGAPARALIRIEVHFDAGAQLAGRGALP